jgi:hypothetical protein
MTAPDWDVDLLKKRVCAAPLPANEPGSESVSQDGARSVAGTFTTDGTRERVAR